MERNGFVGVTNASMVFIDNNDDDDDDSIEDNHKHASGAHLPRSSLASLTSSSSTTSSGTKRQKDISPCYVCGAKAHGYNFDQSKIHIRSWMIPTALLSLSLFHQSLVNHAKRSFVEMLSSQR